MGKVIPFPTNGQRRKFMMHIVLTLELDVATVKKADRLGKKVAEEVMDAVDELGHDFCYRYAVGENIDIH